MIKGLQQEAVQASRDPGPVSPEVFLAEPLDD
jgi:hypothetical protein